MADQALTLYKSKDLAVIGCKDVATINTKCIGARVITYISVAKEQDDDYGVYYRWVRWDSRTDIAHIAGNTHLLFQPNGFARTKERAIVDACAGVIGAVELETSHVATWFIRECTLRSRLFRQGKQAEEALRARYDAPQAEISTVAPDAPEAAFTVEECRRQILRHHPDRGGNREAFELWKDRLDVAKAREARP